MTRARRNTRGKTATNAHAFRRAAANGNASGDKKHHADGLPPDALVNAFERARARMAAKANLKTRGPSLVEKVVAIVAHPLTRAIVDAATASVAKENPRTDSAPTEANLRALRELYFPTAAADQLATKAPRRRRSTRRRIPRPVRQLATLDAPSDRPSTRRRKP